MIKKIFIRGSNVYVTMKYVILFLMFFTYEIDAAIPNQKLVLGVYLSEEEAKKDFDRINHYITTQEKLQKYLQKYKIQLTLKKIEPYTFYALGPIENIKEQHTLYYALHDKFPNMFSVNDTFVHRSMPLSDNITIDKVDVGKVNVTKKTMTDANDEKETSLWVFVKNLQSEWLGLLVLAFVGFILILRSAKQISKIKYLQCEVEEYHNMMNEKVQSMEKKS